MASSNVSISMVISASPDTLRIVQKELHKYAEMVIDENMSVIHIIGSLHWQRTQVESHIMNTIKDIPISQISYGGSDQCFTLSVHTTDKNRLRTSLLPDFNPDIPLCQILYSSILRYKVVRPIFNKRAASVLLPFVYSKTRAMCLRSIAASSKLPMLSSEHS